MDQGESMISWFVTMDQGEFMISSFITMDQGPPCNPYYTYL